MTLDQQAFDERLDNVFRTIEEREDSPEGVLLFFMCMLAKQVGTEGLERALKDVYEREEAWGDFIVTCLDKMSEAAMEDRELN